MEVGKERYCGRRKDEDDGGAKFEAAEFLAFTVGDGWRGLRADRVIHNDSSHITGADFHEEKIAPGGGELSHDAAIAEKDVGAPVGSLGTDGVESAGDGPRAGDTSVAGGIDTMNVAW